MRLFEWFSNMVLVVNVSSRAQGASSKVCSSSKRAAVSFTAVFVCTTVATKVWKLKKPPFVQKGKALFPVHHQCIQSGQKNHNVWKSSKMSQFARKDNSISMKHLKGDFQTLWLLIIFEHCVRTVNDWKNAVVKLSKFFIVGLNFELWPAFLLCDQLISRHSVHFWNTR